MACAIFRHWRQRVFVPSKRHPERQFGQPVDNSWSNLFSAKTGGHVLSGWLKFVSGVALRRRRWALVNVGMIALERSFECFAGDIPLKGVLRWIFSGVSTSVGEGDRNLIESGVNWDVLTSQKTAVLWLLVFAERDRHSVEKFILSWGNHGGVAAMHIEKN